MTVTIDATVGGANSNSFITIGEATQFAYEDLDGIAWLNATVDDQCRALIQATVQLNGLPWVGTRATTTQALSWPRTGAEINGRPIADNEIPFEVKRGEFDLAYALLKEAAAGAAEAMAGNLIPNIPNSQLKRVKLDVMEVEWRTEGLPSNRSNTYSSLVSKAPSLSTVLYGTLTNYGGGSGLLVGVVRS